MMPSVDVFEIVALSDRHLFEQMMSSAGLPILGEVTRDPLDHMVSSESVRAVADVITEDFDQVDLPPELDAIKRMAEALGFIVGLNEATEPKKKDDKSKRLAKSMFKKGSKDKEEKGKPGKKEWQKPWLKGKDK